MVWLSTPYITFIDRISVGPGGCLSTVIRDLEKGPMPAPPCPDLAQQDPSIRHGPEPTRSTLSVSPVSLTFPDHGPGFPPAKLSLRITSFHFTSLLFSSPHSHGDRRAALSRQPLVEVGGRGTRRLLV